MKPSDQSLPQNSPVVIVPSPWNSLLITRQEATNAMSHHEHLLALFESIEKERCLPGRKKDKPRVLITGGSPSEKGLLTKYGNLIIKNIKESGEPHPICEMKKPVADRCSFIVAYPHGPNRRPCLHRDDNVSGYYSVFFLLTRLTDMNGSVDVYENSEECPRNPKVGINEVLQNLEPSLHVPVRMIGNVGDIFTFDGRLLHQSDVNSTHEKRVVFSFSVYDSTKYKKYPRN